MNFLDVDLAGEVLMAQWGIRKTTDYDFPRLQFYAVLKDQAGAILLQGLQNLKERKDKHNAFRMKGSQSDFYLEKDLLKKWFDKALYPAIAKL